ncbi:MAG: DUF2089 domain-containing protein [Bacillota bacterium]|nr:DUF2089 domain-containing protein [Bacillota bacterium]
MEFKAFKKDGFKAFSDFTTNKAKFPVLSQCPVCHHDLVVTELHCDHCNTGVSGAFTLSKFNYLDTEKLYFIEIFVKNRGNIKALEKEMNVSYPTVKKMLDDVITVLGYTPDATPSMEETAAPAKEETPKMSRIEILEKLGKGEISALEAAEQLRKIR